MNILKKLLCKGKISYIYSPGKIYLNITNRCSNKCDFCVRNYTDELAGNYLWLEEEPSLEEIIFSIKEDIEREGAVPDEIIFCGYGEPMFRPYIILEVLKIVKSLYPLTKTRLNTNGQSFLINKGKTFLPELSGLLDSISISLNAQDEKTYREICNPSFGEKAYYSVLNFAKEAVEYIPDVTLSVVGGTPVDFKKCREIASSTGANFRIR